MGAEVTPICPLCGESHDELVALLAQGEVRRTPSRDLVDELEHIQRELTEIAVGDSPRDIRPYFEHRRQVLQSELQRRQRLEKYGGPKVGRNARLPDEILERIKSEASIDVVAWELGIIGQGSRPRIAMRCPYPDHEDVHPSATLYVGEGRWWCHGCNRGGDQIDLVMAARGLAWKEAVAWIADLVGVSLEPPKRAEPPSLEADDELKTLGKVLA
jgi:hypothetical protein